VQRTSAPCSFNVIVGELHFLDDKGNTVAVENWKTSVHRDLAYCKSEGMTPKDITGFAGWRTFP
jgi:hypothetical protein